MHSWPEAAIFANLYRLRSLCNGDSHGRRCIGFLLHKRFDGVAVNGGLLLNVGPSAIALVALGFAAWQIRADRIGSEKSNSLPVASSAFNEFRSQTFQDHLRTVWNEAPSVIPEDGFQSLPTQWRNSAYEVVYFFEYLGILVAYELVPKELVVDFSANLIVRSWNALEPFIQQERLHRKKI